MHSPALAFSLICQVLGRCPSLRLLREQQRRANGRYLVLLSLLSVLVYEEFDRNKAEVNKPRLGQSRPCRTLSQSLTPQGLYRRA